MALSGSFYTNVDNGGAVWRLQLEWSATQSTANNTSTVTARLYWISLDGYGAISSSASKSGSITVDGSSSSFSATAGLRARQKKLIKTYSKTVSHNANGTGSVTLDGYFDVNVSLTGRYVGRVNLSARTYTLNTIPRASSITSSASWTAGSNRSVSISRHSTGFDHDVTWQVKNRSGTWVTVRNYNGVGTSTNGTFTTSEHKEIFQVLDGRSSADSRVYIVTRTKSGGTKIGDTVYREGTCTAPTSSTLTSGTDRSMHIDDSISIGISRKNSNFTHTIKITTGSYTKTITGVGTSTSWNPSTTEENSLYSQLSSVNSRSGTLELTTFYEGVQVRTSRSYSFAFKVRDANPTFGGAFTYRDTNTSTTALTGSNQYIIQNTSTLRVEIPSSAIATSNRGASMVRYAVTVNGVTKDISYSTSTTYADFGTVNASSNITITVKAIDSRGNSTTKSKTISIVPYKSPILQPNAERLNSFEASTTIAITGSISPITIGATGKNSIVTLRYRYKKRSVTTYGSWNNLTGNTGHTINRSVTISFDNLVAWDVQIQVDDRISTKTVNIVVPVGKPILFLDAGKNSVGVNRLPSLDFALEVDGKVYFNNPNTKEGVMPYVGSTANTGREWLAVRADRRGFAEGSGINLYNGSDTLYPNSIRFYAGGSGSSKMIIDEDGIKFRQSGSKHGLSNVLRLSNGNDFARYYSPSSLIGLVNANTIAFIQQTSLNRTIHFGTTSGGRISLEPTGSLYLPNTSGTTVRIEMSGRHMISENSNAMTMYANRSTGARSFKVRSHSNKTGYRDDFWIREDGRFASAHLYDSTSSNASNARVSYSGSASEGMIYRSTSAKKYKTDIQLSDINPYNILELEPKSWYDKGDVMRNGGFTNGLTKNYGLIADELAEVGLHHFIDYINGEIEGLEYERLWVLLIPIIRDQQDMIEKLSKTIEILKFHLERR